MRDMMASFERWWYAIRLRARGLFRRGAVEREIDEEVRFHIDQQAAHLASQGLTPEEAARTAQRQFGNTVAARERLREVDIPFYVDLWWHEVRFACRQLLRSPLYSFVTVLALAIGVGANVTIFSFVNGWLLRPIDAREPDRLLRIAGPGFDSIAAGAIDSEAHIRPADYLEYRDRNRTFSAIAASHPGGPTGVRWRGPVEMIPVTVVTGNYFEMLGISAALGRTLTSADGRFGAREVVVLTDAGWRRFFGADPDAVGTTIFVDGIPHVVAGVLPSWFTGTYAPLVPQIYRPIGERGGTLAFDTSLHLIGRLKPGATAEQARRDLTDIAKELADRDGRQRAIEIFPARSLPPFMLTTMTALAAMFGIIVVVLLLVTCDNIAILTTLRSAARAREIAIRLSLGASRRRVLFQLLVESAVLCVAGGGVGTFIAFATARFATRFYVPVPMPFAVTFTPDWRVAAFAIAVSGLALLLCGFMPARKTLASDLMQAVRRVVTPGGVQAQLVITQVALSTALLVAATVLTHSVQTWVVEAGFASHNVVMSTVALGSPRYTVERRQRLLEDALERIRRTPGVVSATLVANVPAANNAPLNPMRLRSGSYEQSVQVNLASSGLFATLGIHVLAGRDFSDSDRMASGIVNEALARAFWPGQNPVGQTVEDDRGARIEVVGMVRDHEASLAGAPASPLLYRPIWIDPPAAPTFLLKPGGDPRPVMGLAGAVISELDPDLATYNVMLLDDRLNLARGVHRAGAIASGAFGSLALLLGAIGIYGTMAFIAQQRKRDIALRVALGASTREVIRSLTGRSVRWTATGVGVGLALASVGALALSRMLRGVSPWDLPAFAVATAVVLAVAFTASYMPARRASGINPAVVLRDGNEV
jgi:putative ABC transport system permease protein